MCRSIPRLLGCIIVQLIQFDTMDGLMSQVEQISPALVVVVAVVVVDIDYVVDLDVESITKRSLSTSVRTSTPRYTPVDRYYGCARKV